MYLRQLDMLNVDKARSFSFIYNSTSASGIFVVLEATSKYY